MRQGDSKRKLPTSLASPYQGDGVSVVNRTNITVQTYGFTAGTVIIEGTIDGQEWAEVLSFSTPGIKSLGPLSLVEIRTLCQGITETSSGSLRVFWDALNTRTV